MKHTIKKKQTLSKKALILLLETLGRLDYALGHPPQRSGTYYLSGYAKAYAESQQPGEYHEQPF